MTAAPLRAAVLSEHDLAGWAAQFRQGLRPTELPYDVQKLRDHGWSLRGARRAATGAVAKVRDVVEHRAGHPVEQTLRLAPAVAGADVVVALLETQGLAAARAKAAKVWPYAALPLVVWSCWLAEKLSSAPARERRGLVAPWRSADLITVYSSGEVDVLVEAGLAPERVAVLPLGAAEDFYRPDPVIVRDGGIVAIGQDRGRDYATLFEAVRGTDLQVTLICRPENLVGLDVPVNVDVRGTVDHLDYRRILQRAQVVAVPTHDLAYPTGSSVTLEASSCGACVVVTGTRAMREYVADGVTGLHVEAGDVDGWRTTLRRAMAEADLRDRLGRAARARVESELSTTVMWARFDQLVRDRLGLGQSFLGGVAR